MSRLRRVVVTAFLGAAPALWGGSVTACAGTIVLTRLAGDGGGVQYDFHANPSNGWYVQGNSPYRFKLGFKQGERASAHPIEVATVAVDPQERYRGIPSIALQIIARHENEPRSTAYYKVALSIKQEKDHFDLPLDGEETFVHSFAMKIDRKSSIEDGSPVIFEQFWQGSPFAAPVSLTMISPDDARGKHWSDVGSFGNFGLKLNDDDHAPLHKFRTETEYVDLGPIVLGAWMTWQVHVTPSPSQPAGEVRVLLDGKPVADVTRHKVGFDPDNPEYGSQRPSKQFSGVDILLYRKNGDSFQRVYFDDVSLSVVQ